MRHTGIANTRHISIHIWKIVGVVPSYSGGQPTVTRRVPYRVHPPSRWRRSLYDRSVPAARSVTFIPPHPQRNLTARTRSYRTDTLIRTYSVVCTQYTCTSAYTIHMISGAALAAGYRNAIGQVALLKYPGSGERAVGRQDGAATAPAVFAAGCRWCLRRRGRRGPVTP